MILYKIIRNHYRPQRCGVKECGAIIPNGHKFGYTASSRMETARCMDCVCTLIVAGAKHRGSGTRDEYVLVPELSDRKGGGVGQSRNKMTCLTCDGSGARPLSDNTNWLPCSDCGGTGSAAVPTGGFKTATIKPAGGHHTALQLFTVINQPIEGSYP